MIIKLTYPGGASVLVRARGSGVVPVIVVYEPSLVVVPLTIIVEKEALLGLYISCNPTLDELDAATMDAFA